MIGGGYMAYKEIKTSQKKEENENKAAIIAEKSGLHVFSDCNYEGEGDYVSSPIEVKDLSVGSNEGIKSFVLTDGYKIDTYNNKDFTGTKITFTGPQNISCSNRVIKSVKFYSQKDE
jgi:hypothetical protein